MCLAYIAHVLAHIVHIDYEERVDAYGQVQGKQVIFFNLIFIIILVALFIFTVIKC